MCGIFGIVTQTEDPLGQILIDAGQRLSYRGYDSVGYATISGDGHVDLRKDVGKVQDVAGRYDVEWMRGRRGIVQLRWATFGAPSRVNAQPHLDSQGDLVGAHNGNVTNNVELRQQFVTEGMIVRSTNDGESCVHAVERHIKRGHDMVDAIRCAYAELEGDYAFVIGLVADPEHRLYAIKKGSGLVAGISESATFVSSDLPSILPLTRTVLRVQDGEIVILWPNRVELRRISDGCVVERAPETINESMESAVKGGYAHFMLKEIHEQSEVAGALIHWLEKSKHVERMIQRMSNARHLYLIACGTSYHAALLGSVYLARLAGRAAIPVLAPQFLAQYLPAVGPQDVGLFISQSGETKDVLDALARARERGMGALGLVNVLGSTLMNESEYYLPLACGYEISVPATKTFTNQVIALLYLALRLGQQPTEALARLPGLIERTLTEVGPQVQAIEPAFAGAEDFYCAGYGLTYPIALEGALKVKEVTYAHCEGILSTEFKHGPLSAVHDGYPVIFVVGPEDVPLLVSGINETTCRGGRAIVIAEPDSQLLANAQDLVALPKAGPIYNPLLATLPLQLLAYRLSLARGYDPDYPRNLSKTLTVD